MTDRLMLGIGAAVFGAALVAIVMAPRKSDAVSYRGFELRATASTPSKWSASNSSNIPSSTAKPIAASGEAPTRNEALAAAMAWVDKNWP